MRALWVLASLVGSGLVLVAAPPSFREIYQLLQTNLAGVDEAALDQAAARGLIQQLEGKVSLVEPTSEPSTSEPAIGRACLYENDFGYIRIGTFQAGLPDAFAKALAALESTNKLKGLVIDLRNAGGEDYAAATAVATQLFSQPVAIMDYGEGVKKSEANPEALRVPVAVLINRLTAAAAEALAASLRELGRALILGGRTAGRAYVYKNFTLESGHVLRMALVPVKLSTGKPVAEQGVVPDLAVEVKFEDEAVYLRDPFALTEADRPSPAAAARSPRRMTEADLVRMLRENQEPDFSAEPPRESAPARNLIRDPVLARALDVLKGLAVVQQSRSF